MNVIPSRPLLGPSATPSESNAVIRAPVVVFIFKILSLGDASIITHRASPAEEDEPEYVIPNGLSVSTESTNSA